MSDVHLAYKYDAENYPLALDNLVKRAQDGDDEPIHYQDAAFGEISKSKSTAILKFLARAEIIDSPKAGHYTVPEEVVDWNRKFGPTKEEAKEQVRENLREYEVYKETEFVLDENSLSLDSLAEQVGGLVGIDEDEVSDLKRTIRVFAELGFLEIDSEGVVSLEDGKEQDDGEGTEESQKDSAVSDEKLTDFSDVSAADTTTAKTASPEPKPRTEGGIPESISYGSLSADLDISIDVTDMEADELREKLEIINNVLGHDEE